MAPNRKKRPIPLAPKPTMMTSRKKARKVTTMFHKLTRERDEALQKGNQEQVQTFEQQLQDMGGRKEYQRASQLSTSFHSTSKWVLGHLARRGWLYGVFRNMPLQQQQVQEKEEEGTARDNDKNTNTKTTTTASSKKKRPRRTTRLLEVGAINTELLDAAAETTQNNNYHNNNDNEDEASTATSKTTTRKYRLDVRAIDIHSMEKERIEEADFLTLPFTDPDDANQRYDVIVCSMVLNCVTTPADRGKMLARLYHHLRPGGLCFLTIPKFCLTKSAFLTTKVFKDMLGKGGAGFSVEETKESPRLSFFICRRPEEERTDALKSIWKKQVIRNKGKKFPNQFSIILNEDEVFGRVKI